ncbi:CHC2 zinc finger domain-containing protein [Flavobacterium sp. Fl-318]|uniref:CHC2 zinc finger domain-containing protein n=1 Tax=Flavobacterium cupriresistens TaxID=2893885 RepID=A0ABU4R599_9FLAO|nr:MULTISPECIES: CHC2 zinc finger domain-containing protein [unclassified Flavobacterium]MDX6187753.1 CHC2 zinc finger domain-containing protein [Flavobacterium sp. Fl-318]MDX6187759.1 CHC2 zinc finger domain-containing protein [Flavobacterium sp. Fl-318]UFH42318.1 CHC2 zinc finger domain-containing protein [Flavobacterium sp. F-323]UFH42325.1 CHC2 zinc finger domain-containing protein [Flavobacterium sp. F-323]
MEIQDIKQSLTLATILNHYSIKPDKNNMLCCPFHEDNTASLQVNPIQNRYKCHACDKKGDVIQFVQDYEKLTKREAILKCVALIGINPMPKSQSQKTEIITENKSIFLEKMFQSFRKGIFNSNPAKDYCRERNLNIETLQVGFNGGQFHHGTRRDETLINNCLAVGLLLDRNIISKTGEKAYNVFGSKCIVFPLKNKENQIVSLYFRSILNQKEAKHFYLKNRTGLYPNYPDKNTKKLILTESIIDCASLLQIGEIAQNYSLLACYGTNGLGQEIEKAIAELTELEEIIFCFDNDNAGEEAVKKYASQLKQYKISTIELPNKDINETLQLHEDEIIIELLNQRKELIFFSIEEKTTTKPKTNIDFLKQNNLLQELNVLIEKSGIIGEENSRLLLFIIASSYKTKSPLHAIVQGSSGSGKTHLISKIADLIPPEDVLRFTRITESSLYNWGEYDLVGKLLIIEDLDGLKEEAMFAMRELISNQRLSSSVSIKDKKGNIKSAKKEVRGVFSSLSATTKGELYEDNMSRSFLLAVDESGEQSQRIIHYQNRKYAGEIEPKDQEKTKIQLQQIIRTLTNYEVINPFATRLELPEEVHKIRRLNEMFQSIVRQITLLNQHHRELKNDKLITQIEDLEQATEVLFESIILKVDELDGSLRQFFERVKKYLKTQDKDFTQREIRQAFNMSKSQIHRYLQALLELEYIKQIGGYANKGLKYKIDYWDDYAKLRIKIKDKLLLQIKALKETV